MSFNAVRRLLPFLAGAGLLAACSTGEIGREPEAFQGVVDSIFPVEEEIRRFAATVDSVPATLREVARNREELVARFLQAVERGSPEALAPLVLQRDEFIGLYYPHTRYTTRPYEMAPALLWFQMENLSSRGVGRLLERHGGTVLDYRSTTCPEAPRVEDRNRIWEGCTVTWRAPDGATVTRQLFGGILERDGRWKFLSYANEY